MYISMLDGIKYSLVNNKSEDELLKELSKSPGEFYGYLEKERAYRSEEDVFDYYNDKERNSFLEKLQLQYMKIYAHLKIILIN